MKKSLIAALVGGVIIFIWQFISWGAANLHGKAQQYTPKQEAIMSFLQSQQLEEGGYMMPSLPRTASSAEWTALMESSDGKPWMSVQVHNSMQNNMVMNMVRSLIVNVLTVALLCWVLVRLQAPTSRTIFLASLFTGLIVFFNAPYTGIIWYSGFDIWAHLADAVVSWGACGLWLAWWLRRDASLLSSVRVENRTRVTA
jgi:hypothetical protein